MIKKMYQSIALLIFLPISWVLAPKLEVSVEGCKFSKLLSTGSSSLCQSDYTIVALHSLLDNLDLRQYLGKKTGTINLDDLSNRLSMGFDDFEMVISLPITGDNSTTEYISKIAQHYTLQGILDFMINGEDIKLLHSVFDDQPREVHLRFDPQRSVVQQLEYSYPNPNKYRYVFDFKNSKPQIARVEIAPRFAYTTSAIGNTIIHFAWPQSDEDKQQSITNQFYSGLLLGDKIDLKNGLPEGATVELISTNRLDEDEDWPQVSREFLDSINLNFLRFTTAGSRIIFPFRCHPTHCESFKEVFINPQNALNELYRLALRFGINELIV